jgi:uncharacterized protein YlxW (UPF0749 family)
MIALSTIAWIIAGLLFVATILLITGLTFIYNANTQLRTDVQTRTAENVELRTQVQTLTTENTDLHVEVQTLSTAIESLAARQAQDQRLV